MVGSLNLSNACEGEPLDMMSCSAERVLDSPDSGLPPSPSPSTWLLPGAAERAGPVCDDEPRVLYLFLYLVCTLMNECVLTQLDDFYAPVLPPVFFIFLQIFIALKKCQLDYIIFKQHMNSPSDNHKLQPNTSALQCQAGPLAVI